MLHFRERHLSTPLKKQGKFWPVVGVLGLRQSGKSTLLRDHLELGTYVTLDEEQAKEEALLSPTAFLEKLPRPLILDEVQRAPKIFESIKWLVDKKKKPGSFFLTGSSQFSSRLGIRESLTGRIGLNYLYPMTLAESHQKTFETLRANPLHKLKTRFKNSVALAELNSGALPVPVFTRNVSQIKSYFQSWMETSILRDAQRSYGRNYDPDFAQSIIHQMGKVLTEGEYPSLKYFKQDSRRIRRYLQALEDIFIIQKIVPSSKTIGTDLWTFTDTGILSYICGNIFGEGTHLSLIRTFILKEVRALCEYSENRIRLEFYKTSRSAPVDFIWDGIPVKISVAPLSQVEYDLRPLRSAIKTLKAPSGILMTGRDSQERDGNIRIVPWTHFS